MAGVEENKAGFLAHLIAALAAMLFAFGISQTALVTSGIQFVAPLFVLIACHLVLMAIFFRGIGFVFQK